MRYLLILINTLAIIISTQAQNDKVSALVREQWKNGVKVECLVLLQQQADLSEAKIQENKAARGQYVFDKLKKVAEASQGPLREYLEAKSVHYIPFYIVNALMVEADSSLLLALAKMEEVKAILPNLPIQSAFPVDYSAPIAKNNDNIEWGIKQIKADLLWDLGIKGQGVVVGGQDTGYDWLHPAIHKQYRGYKGGNSEHHYHWHDAIHSPSTQHADTLNPCGFNILAPCDDHSHGTHTVGTMVGYDGQDNYIGVAPQAQWIGCRNMERGWGTPATYIECFEWFLAPTDLNGQNPNPAAAPHVINNSWSCPEYEGCHPSNFEVMRLAVAQLRAAGVVVVVSAGNSGPDCNSISAPAAIFEESFTIAASTPADTIVRFSSRGTVTSDASTRLKPNVAAPGTAVRSAVLNGGYASYSGTSMAGPHVAAAVALLISADPELAGKVELIEEILEQSAMPIYTEQNCNDISGSSQPNTSAGWGRIDMLQALSIVRPDLVHQITPKPKELRAFPNPTKGKFMLVAPQDLSPSILRVYNVSGQLVAERPIGFIRVGEIDLSDIPNGVYVLQISHLDNKKVTFMVKLIKI